MTMRSPTRRLLSDDRGDAPGWLLVGVMSAALVLLAWVLAGPALESVIRQVVAGVTGGA